MSKKIAAEIEQIVTVEEVADIVGISGRHMRRIMNDQNVPRAGHGKVKLADGLRAALQAAETGIAKDVAKRWTDDVELQRVITWALVAHWRGRDAELAKLAK